MLSRQTTPLPGDRLRVIEPNRSDDEILPSLGKCQRGIIGDVAEMAGHDLGQDATKHVRLRSIVPATEILNMNRKKKYVNMVTMNMIVRMITDILLHANRGSRGSHEISGRT
jgi:hypothetical protein